LAHQGRAATSALRKLIARAAMLEKWIRAALNNGRMARIPATSAVSEAKDFHYVGNVKNLLVLELTRFIM
jgi:hypothetical protein